VRSRPELVALVVIALSCHSSDAHVGCSPSLTCSLRDKRFAPPEPPDAGPARCNAAKQRCDAAALAAGGTFNCLVAPAGELLCWGDDREGQLGRGLSAADAGADEQATDAGLATVVDHALQVAAGAAHACAIVRGGALLCWGRDAEGQVDGHASSQPAYEPRAVALPAVTAVSAGGAHSCAVSAQGVICWGSALYGQVGRAAEDTVLPPALVVGTEGAVEVAAGVRHSCARWRDGHVSCWGELYDDDGHPQLNPVPALVADVDDAIQITAGAGHSCALRPDGSVWCWGLNDSGQLGDGSLRSSASPVQVQELERALQVSAGGIELDGALVAHTCAQTKSFFVQCWGRNSEGQLGIGSAGDSPIAQVVLGEPGEEDDEPFLPDVTQVAAGGLHTCAIDHDGAPRCWGDDSHAQLGQAPGSSPPFGRVKEVSRFGAAH
jgi:alpha-tubulin suppressor-like RCC1 family protein